MPLSPGPRSGREEYIKTKRSEVYAADAEAAAAAEAEDEGRIVDLPSLASLVR